jgi:hypothetical protein
MTRCMASFFFPWIRCIGFLTPSRDLDKHLGDLYPSIIGMFSIRNDEWRATRLKNEEDRELEIIHELAEKVLPFSGAISEACDICAELDCLLCFAEATNQYSYRRPQMSEENVFNIKQGRYGAFSVIPQYNRSSVADCWFATYTGTHCRNKPSTRSYQTTSSLSAERELGHTRLFTVKATTSCRKEVYGEIA